MEIQVLRPLDLGALGKGQTKGSCARKQAFSQKLELGGGHLLIVRDQLGAEDRYVLTRP